MNLDLRAGQPYVGEQVKLVITGGALDLAGRVRCVTSQPGAPLVNFTGDLAVNKFTTTDAVLFKDFIQWDALTVGGINMDLLPNKLHVDQVKFTGLNTSLVVGPDPSPEPGNHPAKSTRQNQPAAADCLRCDAECRLKPLAGFGTFPLGALVLDNAAIHFSDQSLEPHCSFDVQEFGG